MEDEIVPADPKLRRRVQWWVGFLTVGGLIASAILYSFLPGIKDPAAGEDIEVVVQSATRLAMAVAWVTGLSFVAIGLWFLGLACRVRRSGRFPPPGMKVIKDTPVRTGTKANDLANLATAAGLFSAVLGSAAAWQLYRLAIAALGQVVP